MIAAVANMNDWKATWKREMLEVEKESLRELLKRFSVIGRVVSSDSLIKVIISFDIFCLLL